ncbi:hypothetical protein ECSTECMHI813_2664 [Escherichia coli STEC_MHI813]|nr:hypothetical protein ECSTECMHI813_2664 [Escherichia coli STEC_MHI813]KIO87557.1 hypothetical protein EC970264_2657 [Escherichia coli 97.0264]
MRRERLIRPTKFRKFNILQEKVGLISVAHQAILCLSSASGGTFLQISTPSNVIE